MDIKSKILASEIPVDRLVKFQDGTEATLYFKQPTAGDFRRWREAERSGDDDARVFGQQRLVAASLCDERGKLVLTAAESQRLTLQGLNDLLPHVLAVAGVGDDAKKESPSAESTGSDTSSP